MPHKKQAKEEEKDQITVYGKIIFPKDNIPKVLPANSHMKVDFSDFSIQDASSHIIASTEIDLSTYSKDSGLNYEIKCRRPPAHDFYEVSAVLNMGWKPNKDDWIRKKDYHTTTAMMVKITDEKIKYEQDIQLEYYQ